MPNLDAKGHRYAVVISRFNERICQKLLEGALQGLKEHGVASEHVCVKWVPGAFEIPLIAKKMAESQKYDGVICLGAVIRGETAHFELVAEQAAKGILEASLSTDVPVIFSVLATENREQANARAGGVKCNLGHEGALSAIEMVNVLKELCD